MSRKRATLTDLLNDVTFKTIYRRNKLLACNRFDWTGLEAIPDLLPRHIEALLYEHGRAGLFRRKGGGLMCLKCDPAGSFTVYDEPTAWRMTGHGFSTVVKAEDCVIIRGNPQGYDMDKFIYFYSNKLAECERTADVNVKRCKTPYILACDENDVLTVKKMLADIDGNVPAIVADKALKIDSLAVFQTGVSFLGPELQDYKKSVENELLTFLGINNLAVDKKERVNVEEAESNNEVINHFAVLELESRQQACDEAREKFGIDIQVMWKGVREENVDNERHDESDTGAP